MISRHFFRWTAALVSIVAIAACAQQQPQFTGQRTLHESTSAFNQLYVTEETDGLRTLRFERYGARQSVVKPGDPEHLELVYSRVAMASLVLSGEPRNVLIFGLGGGSIPMFLRNRYPDANIDVVDIDPGVVTVATKYFGFRQDAKLKAHVMDAREFAEKVRKPTYDLVFLDAFGRDSVPVHLTTVEFLRAVHNAMTPNGVAIGNVWGRAFNRLYDPMIRTYQETFEDLYILDGQGDVNKIVLGLKRKVDINQKQFAEQARALSKAKGFRFDVGALVELGFVHALERDPAQSVLRDAELVSRP